MFEIFLLITHCVRRTYEGSSNENEGTEEEDVSLRPKDFVFRMTLKCLLSQTLLPVLNFEESGKQKEKFYLAPFASSGVAKISQFDRS